VGVQTDDSGIQHDSERAGTKFDRPKYGVLNVTKDPAGVHSCLQYGDCYLELHPSVIARCTLSNEDSGGLRGHELATADFYAHVLYRYSDTELKTVLNVAWMSGTHASSHELRVYKECQIHGPISFEDGHVVALHIPSSNNNLAELTKVADEKDWKLVTFAAADSSDRRRGEPRDRARRARMGGGGMDMGGIRGLGHTGPFMMGASGMRSGGMEEGVGMEGGIEEGDMEESGMEAGRKKGPKKEHSRMWHMRHAGMGGAAERMGRASVGGGGMGRGSIFGDGGSIGEGGGGGLEEGAEGGTGGEGGGMGMGGIGGLGLFGGGTRMGASGMRSGGMKEGVGMEGGIEEGDKEESGMEAGRKKGPKKEHMRRAGMGGAAERMGRSGMGGGGMGRGSIFGDGGSIGEGGGGGLGEGAGGGTGGGGRSTLFEANTFENCTVCIPSHATFKDCTWTGCIISGAGQPREEGPWDSGGGHGGGGTGGGIF